MGSSGGGCPLGKLVNVYLDSQTLDYGIQCDIDANPLGPLGSWNRFSWVMRSKEHGPALRALFTDSQNHSSQLILEWMNENGQDPKALFRPILTKMIQWRLRENETDDQPLDGSVDFKGSIYPDRAGTIPGYDESIQRLASGEFVIFSRVQKLSVSQQERLDSARRTAIMKDYCRRMAMHCYKGDVYSGSPGSLEDGPSLKSCPWLDEKRLHEGSLNGWPEFLFDTNTGRTVKTRELDRLPTYSAISHTWGRWREHGNPPVEVEGVPWPIPRNTQFDVRTIPDSLQKCSFITGYVWLDLVCIPQNGSEIAVREIGRQAAIFRNASRAIAWLHDVNDLSCLGALYRWLALSSLLFESGSSEASQRDKMMDKEWVNIAHKPSGLLVHTTEPNPLFRELNPWFTSLWTLQELCLRPDMLLASSDLEILSIDRNLRMPLNALILVFNELTCGIWPATELIHFLEEHRKNHFALRELSHWFQSSGLADLLRLSRIDILILGDQRKCDMRRSEAIMSALGMTTWFHETPREQHESNLVLGKYHPAFVEEVRLTIPGEFFGSFHKNPSPKEKIKSSDSVPLTLPWSRDGSQVSMAIIKQYQWATLLPISAFSTFYLRAFREDSLLFQGHKTLFSWEIRQSGEVHIPKVCLLSSSVQGVATQPSQLPCDFDGLFKRTLGEPEVDASLPFELNQWIRSRPYEVHAVVTSFAVEAEDTCLNGTLVTMSRRIIGVVLRKLDDGSFLKMGNFEVMTDKPVALPDVLEVDWTVI